MPNHLTLELSQGRERESLSALLANYCRERRESSQSGVGSLVWRVCDERKKLSQSHSKRGERNRETLKLSSLRNESQTALNVECANRGDSFGIVILKALTVYCLHGWPLHISILRAHLPATVGQVSHCQSKIPSSVCLCRKIRCNTIRIRTCWTQSMITARKRDRPLVPIKAHCFHTSASDRNKIPNLQWLSHNSLKTGKV